jgi:hypothetical protein
MRNSNDRLYAFSGLMYSGKDFVAKYSKLNVASIAEPIYELCDYFNSTRNKSVPGIRRWMQLIGQWGWGHVDEEYLLSVERGVITDLIRRFGKQMTTNFSASLTGQSSARGRTSGSTSLSTSNRLNRHSKSSARSVTPVRGRD